MFYQTAKAIYALLAHFSGATKFYSAQIVNFVYSIAVIYTGKTQKCISLLTLVIFGWTIKIPLGNNQEICLVWLYIS